MLSLFLLFCLLIVIDSQENCVQCPYFNMWVNKIDQTTRNLKDIERLMSTKSAQQTKFSLNNKKLNEVSKRVNNVLPTDEEIKEIISSNFSIVDDGDLETLLTNVEETSRQFQHTLDSLLRLNATECNFDFAFKDDIINLLKSIELNLKNETEDVKGRSEDAKKYAEDVTTKVDEIMIQNLSNMLEGLEEVKMKLILLIDIANLYDEINRSNRGLRTLIVAQTNRRNKLSQEIEITENNINNILGELLKKKAQTC